MTLLLVHNLKKTFPVKRGVHKAVDGVSFAIEKGEIVGLVGASGSGKSTVGQTVMRLIEPTSGQIFLHDKDLCTLSRKELRRERLSMQMIFQDPLLSLNPRKTIGENVGEVLLYRKIVKTRAEQREQVGEVLSWVGLASSAIDSYPHEFSGGQQQRVAIARALITNPELVICDEVTSALDLSIQAQILNVLYELKCRLNLSYLFISHDLRIVRHFCDRVLVMESGKIVEEGLTAELFARPQHPYTQSLLKGIS